MRSCEQLEAWCAGAAAQFGDPSAPVCQIFARWKDYPVPRCDDDIACGIQDGEFVIFLGPEFPRIAPRVILGEPLIRRDGGLEAFGAELVAPGVWALDPSLNIEGVIHAFVVLCGVPDPAPWERRILLP